ncbi:hypothetical protein [Paenibacillus sp. J22TS3]|uniref:hypothetical protein n=1 Tax=Paenibacillus sp. J22TS3 TaxID=2807192 RepID=UPI001B1E8C6A|nr:hypothetical protein [Paenibacillus sp. J22TS3]GIP21219.1 hypothetical protein J22TS3_14940 [Paenibacillus sp. J22TS3]
MDVFVYDSRLGIKVPQFETPFEELPLSERAHIIEVWEDIRGTIPTRVMELEQVIVSKLLELGEENNFEQSCRINSDIAELASIVNDLHIWYRVSAEVSEGKRHS